jgi:hypothetical protein
MYTDITSPYIKHKLQETAWKDHAYIDHLVALHTFIVKPPANHSSAVYFCGLKHTYHVDYLQLLKETDHTRYKKAIKRQKQEKEELSHIKSEAKQQNEQKYLDWCKAGGK